LARLFGLRSLVAGLASSRDPWVDESLDVSSWNMHVYDARTGHVAMDLIVEAAERFNSSMAETMHQAYEFFSSATAHVISDDQMESIRHIYKIQSRHRGVVPPSRISPSQLDILVDHGIAALDVEEGRPTSVFAFLLPEPSKIPPRMRVIVDTLQANIFLDNAPKTAIRNTRELLGFFGRFTFFCSFDFKCYYFQFEWPEDVSQCYVGSVGGRRFRMKRCPMGHKNAVKHCHSVSEFVAQLAIFEASATCCAADVIIDNVVFGSRDEVELRRVEAKFIELCRRFNIVIGDHQTCSDQIQHRGLEYSSRLGFARLKASWRSKFTLRVASVLQSPSFERLRSLCGMINYIRIYYGSGFTAQGVPVGFPIPSSFFVWKTLARWSASPRRRCSLSSAVAGQLMALSEFVAGDPPISVIRGIAESSQQILITDACKTGPFSAWGAVLIDGDDVRVASGHFAFGERASISPLELRAVGCGLLAFSDALSTPGDFKELVLLIDNTAALHCLTRGASSVPSMMQELNCVSDACLAVRRILRPRYIASKFNPADEPSRDRLLVDSKVVYARHLGSSKG
jgi:hypothetical protein